MCAVSTSRARLPVISAPSASTSRIVNVIAKAIASRVR